MTYKLLPPPFVFCSSVIIISLLTSCQQDDKGLKSFYFPYEALQEGQVYTYDCLSHPEVPDDVWFYKTLTRNDSSFLISQYYDSEGNVKQLSIEHMDDSAARTDSVILMFGDRPVYTRIKRRAVFPFFTPDSTQIAHYQIQWTDFSDSLQYTLGKRRTFEGHTSIESEGRKKLAVEFSVLVDLETFREDKGATNSEWREKEIYAESIGLFRYEKIISDEFHLIYELVKRESMDEFLAK